jgi:hypothetical protein
LKYQISSSSKRNQDLKISRIIARIGKPRALICQFLLMVKRANPSKSKLFGVVACPKTGIVEFSHPLDQSG